MVCLRCGNKKIAYCEDCIQNIITENLKLQTIIKENREKISELYKFYENKEEKLKEELITNINENKEDYINLEIIIRNSEIKTDLYLIEDFKKDLQKVLEE